MKTKVAKILLLSGFLVYMTGCSKTVEDSTGAAPAVTTASPSGTGSNTVNDYGPDIAFLKEQINTIKEKNTHFEEELQKRDVLILELQKKNDEQTDLINKLTIALGDLKVTVDGLNTLIANLKITVDSMSGLGAQLLALTNEFNSFKLWTQTKIANIEHRLEGIGTHEDLTTIRDRLGKLEIKTDSLSAGSTDEGKALFISGVNVFIRNGMGKTDSQNGLGNLILGHNERQPLFSATDPTERTGSHNIIVGINQNYSSYSGVLAGHSNAVTAPFATVTGGFRNIATGEASSVSGGIGIKLEGKYSWAAGCLRFTYNAENSTYKMSSNCKCHKDNPGNHYGWDACDKSDSGDDSEDSHGSDHSDHKS